TVNLARDTPSLARQLATSWGPRVDKWVQAYLERGATPTPKEDGPTNEPAFEISQTEDGTFTVELKGGVDLVQAGPQHWRIVHQHEKQPDRFRLRDLMNDGLERLVGFVKLNALSIIKLGQTVISQVARTVFLVFMTLMVA